MRENRNIFSNIDWITVGIYLVLVMFGWLNIYAAKYNDEHQSILDFSQQYGKQLIWIAAAIVIALVIMLIDAKFFAAFSYPIYGITILLLIAVIFLGKEKNGARSWFEIGSFALQPSEFTKFAVNLAIAKYLSTLNVDIKKLKTKILLALIIIVPGVLIILQNDTGSALVYLTFIFVLYRFGLSGNILIIGLIVIVLFSISLLFNKFIIIGILAAVTAFLVYAYRRSRKGMIIIAGIFLIASAFVFTVNFGFDKLLEPHQKQRINVLFGKDTDLKGAGYNVNQSKIAIGSGGFFGKGFLNGTQTKYDFVPEQSTDFIFCTVGEEWGFLGSSLVVGLFIWLFTRLIFMAERQRSLFAKIYGYGVAFILFIHFLINVGMTLGIAPVIGIPLPFFSYGGSSLWSFTILLFIFIKQDSNRLQLL